MQPVFRKQLSGRPLALCDLIFVMRELQIHSTRMKIKCLAEVFHRHRRAFDMPARTATAKRSFPSRLFVFADKLPEGEITGVLFIVFVCINTLAAPGDISRQADL